MVIDPSAVLARVHHAPEQKLWIPGEGEVDVRIIAAKRVCREYDERLILARHELTRDWVVFIKLEGDRMYPVIGLGPELPANAEDLRQRLWKADAHRHGDKVLREVNEHNERIKRDARRRAIEGDEAVAEALEWGFRQEGVLARKVFVPRDL